MAAAAGCPKEGGKRSHDDVMIHGDEDHYETPNALKRPCMESMPTVTSSFWYTGTLLAQVSSYLHHRQDLIQWRLLLPSAAQRLWLDNVTNFTLCIPNWTTASSSCFEVSSLQKNSSSHSDSNKPYVNELYSKYRHSMIYIMTVECVVRFVQYWWPNMPMLRQLSITGIAIHSDDIIPIIMPTLKIFANQLTHLTLHPSPIMNILYDSNDRSLPRFGTTPPQSYIKPALTALTYLACMYYTGENALHQWFSAPYLQDWTLYIGHQLSGLCTLMDIKLEHDPSNLQSLSLIPISVMKYDYNRDEQPPYIAASPILSALRRYTALKRCFIGFDILISSPKVANTEDYLPPCNSYILYNASLFQYLCHSAMITHLTLTSTKLNRVHFSLEYLKDVRMPNLITLAWPFYIDQFDFLYISIDEELDTIKLLFHHAFKSVWPNVRILSPNFRFFPFMWRWLCAHKNQISFMDSCPHHGIHGSEEYHFHNDSNRHVIYLNAETELDLLDHLQYDDPVTAHHLSTINEDKVAFLPILKHVRVYNVEIVSDVVNALSKRPMLWARLQSIQIAVQAEAVDLMTCFKFDTIRGANDTAATVCTNHAPYAPNLRAFNITAPIIYETDEDAAILLAALIDWLPSELRYLNLSMTPSVNHRRRLLSAIANQSDDMREQLHYDGLNVPNVHWNTLARKFPKLRRVILGGSISVQGVDLTLHNTETHLQQDLLPMPHLQSFLFTQHATMAHPTKSSHIQWLIHQMTSRRAEIIPLMVAVCDKEWYHTDFSFESTPTHGDEANFVPYDMAWNWTVEHNVGFPPRLRMDKGWTYVGVWSFSHPSNETFEVQQEDNEATKVEDVSPYHASIDLSRIGNILKHDHTICIHMKAFILVQSSSTKQQAVACLPSCLAIHEC